MKPSRLKNILTTASIAAVIFGYSNTVLAVGNARKSQGVAPTLSTGSKMDKDGTKAAVPFITGSTFKFNNPNATITADIADVSILAIDTNAKANAKLDTIENVLIGSVIGGAKLTNTIQAGKKSILSGTGSDGSLAAPNPVNDVANQFAAGANDYGAMGDVDFTGVGAILEINNSGLAGGPNAAEAGKAITLKGAFTTPGNGTLNVITPLIATDASVIAIDIINVGVAGTASSFTIDGSASAAGGADINIFSTVIALEDVGSILKLTNSAAAPATFNMMLPYDPSAGAGAGPKGIVELNAHTGAGGLILKGTAGGETLGVLGGELTELRITGDQKVTIAGGGEVDLTNVKLLNVQNTMGLIAQTATVTAIPVINIGKERTTMHPVASDAIDGIFVIDSVNADLQGGGNKIIFKTANSVLQIQNTSVGGGVIADLKNTLAVANDDSGIVKLQASGVGGGALTIDDTAVGVGGTSLGTDDTHRLRELNVGGSKNINVKVGVFAKKITLEGTGGAEFTKAVNSGAGSEIKFNADKPIKFSEDVTVETTDFNNRAGTIEIAAGKKLKTKLTSTGGVKGKVKFAGAGELIGGAAAGAVGIEEVMADGGAATILKVTGKHKVTELRATNASTIEFINGAGVEGGVNTVNGLGAVKLDLKGNNSISGGIGRVGHLVGDITLAGDNNKFKGDIFTSKIIANGAEFVVEDDTTVHGDFEGVGTKLNLGEKTLTLEDAVLTGNVKFVVTTQGGGAEIGHVIVDGAGKVLDLSKAGAVAIEMTTGGYADVVGKNYVIFRKNAAMDVKPFAGTTVADTNAAVGWTFDPATSTLTPKDNAAAAIIVPLLPAGDPQAKEIGDSFANRELGSPADKVVQGIAKLPFELREDAINDELPIVTTGENIAAVNSAVADVITSAVSGNVATISSRMGDIASPVGSSFGAPSFDGGGVVSPDSSNSTSTGATTTGTGTGTGGNQRKAQEQTEAYGVAAGDAVGVKMGLWATPFYSSSIQKLRGQTPGYKATSTGGTVGFDGMITDTSILGAAFTYVDTKIKHRNEKVGDKTRAATYMGSLYGVQSLKNNFFAQGILSYSHNKIKNNESRSLTKETARGNYNSDSYGGEVLLGKNFNVASGTALTPMIGVRYTKFYDKGYTETGASINNLTVKKKNSEKCEGILGARLTGVSYVNETTLLPEIHGFVNHDFIGKKPKVDARFDGSKGPLATRAIKPTKTFYNVGTGITAKHKNMEYSIGYDAHLAKKYVGHQGSLKIRVNL